MKKGVVIVLALMFMFSLTFVSAAVDLNDDGRISFGEWLRTVFKSTGNAITGFSIDDGGNSDSKDSSKDEPRDEPKEESKEDSKDDPSGIDEESDEQQIDSEIKQDSGDSDSSGSSSSGSDKDESRDSDDEEKEDSSDSDGKDDESKTESGDSDEEKSEERFTIIDEQGREVEVKIKTSIDDDGEIETKETRTFIDENGNEVKITIETEMYKGESKTETKRKITSPDGTEITFKTKTEIEDGETKTKTSVEINGASFETKLSVSTKVEDGETKVVVKLSTGVDQVITTTPDEAALLALEEFRSTNNFNLELTEFSEGNEVKAVFKATAVEQGKFLGLFNTQINLETLIDTQTGEIIQTERPWWAFLIVGADEANVCHATDAGHVVTTNVLITEVKDHLAHGDSVGECVVECGDGIIVEGIEACDDGNVLNGDGCNSLCQIEVAENSTIIENITLENNTIENNTFENITLENNTFENSTIKNVTLENNTFENNTIENNTLENITAP